MYIQKDEQENDPLQNTLFSKKQSRSKVLCGWSTFGGDGGLWRKHCRGRSSVEKVKVWRKCYGNSGGSRVSRLKKWHWRET